MTTATHTISRELVRDTMEAAGIEETVETLNDTYSGRAMFGATCMSFVIEGSWGISRRVAKFFAVLAANEAYDMVDEDPNANGSPTVAEYLAEALTIDNLGLDTIVYFPGWTLAD